MVTLVKTAVFYLHNIPRIRSSLRQQDAETLKQAFITSQLEVDFPMDLTMDFTDTDS